MKIRIEISEHDVDGLAALRQFERRCFPNHHCIVHLEGCYVLELQHERATFVRELLEAEMNDPAFMNFGAWRSRNEDQQELFVGATAELPPYIDRCDSAAGIAPRVG